LNVISFWIASIVKAKRQHYILYNACVKNEYLNLIINDNYVNLDIMLDNDRFVLYIIRKKKRYAFNNYSVAKAKSTGSDDFLEGQSRRIVYVEA